MKENFLLFKQWQVHEKISQDMRNFGISKLRKVWRGILVGIESDVIESFKRNHNDFKAAYMQEKFDNEMKDMGFSKLHKHWCKILKAGQAAAIDAMKYNTSEWKLSLAESKMQEMHDYIVKSQQNSGLSRLKAIWEEKLKGKPSVVISTWRYNVHEHRMKILHAHIAVQVAETSLGHATKRCQMLLLRMIRGELAIRLRVWKQNWLFMITGGAKLETGAQQIKKVLRERLKSRCIRLLGSWSRNKSSAKLKRLAMEQSQLAERIAQEAQNRVEDEKSERLRERQVAATIVEKSQEAMEQARARASELEKRAREGLDGAGVRALQGELREEKERTIKLEKRLKALESTIEKSNMAVSQKDQQELMTLRAQLDNKEQERLRLLKQIDDLKRNLESKRNENNPVVAIEKKPERTPPKPKAEKPDADLTREERMLRAAEKRANNNWPGFVPR